MMKFALLLSSMFTLAFFDGAGDFPLCFKKMMPSLDGEGASPLVSQVEHSSDLRIVPAPAFFLSGSLFFKRRSS